MKLPALVRPLLPPDLRDKEWSIRWPREPQSQQRLILTLVAMGLILYAFGIDKTCVANERAMSVFRWLASYWTAGQDYAHGYLVPLVTLGILVWKWRTVLYRTPMQSGNAGLWVVVGAMFLYWVGVRSANPRILAASLPILLFGLSWYLAGWRWARETWFAWVFLFFMIPVNFLDPIIAFPLRMFTTTFAVKILNLFGMEVVQQGTAIHSVKGTFEPLDVADPCSGIRSLIALMALTAVYGYVTMDRAWKKWLLFACAIPLAVLGNLARIVTIAFVAQGFGQEVVLPLYHDYSGYIVFSLAILCMLAISTLMNTDYRELIHRWLHEEVSAPRPVRRASGS